MTTSKIQLHGMAFFGYHGVYAEEQAQGQPFVVDLTLHADLSAAARSDRLADTVNYAEVYSLCRQIVEQERFQLLEALAGRLLDAVLAACPRVTAATVTVKKPKVALGGPLEFAAVELSRTRA